MMLALGSGGSTTLSVTVRSRYKAVIGSVDSPRVRESIKFKLSRPGNRTETKEVPPLIST
jgi:hypothetical protein